jgi:hypothetical protein
MQWLTSKHPHILGDYIHSGTIQELEQKLWSQGFARDIRKSDNTKDYHVFRDQDNHEIQVRPAAAGGYEVHVVRLNRYPSGPSGQ